MYPSKTNLKNVSSLYRWSYKFSLPFLSQYISKYYDIAIKPAIVGKYHIGSASYKYLPHQRGFTNDNNLFFLSGFVDYLTKNYCISFQNFDAIAISEGIDLDVNITSERNELFGDYFCANDLYNNSGIKNDLLLNDYIEDLFANQVLKIINESLIRNPDEPYFILYSMPTPHSIITTPPNVDLNENIIDYDRNCGHIDDHYRMTYCKMMVYVDCMIQHILDTVNLNDTIIIITSDNGGEIRLNVNRVGTDTSSGQSLPLRGAKETPFEGGQRTGAVIYGGWDFLGDYYQNGCDYNGLFYIADWIPTLMGMIGIDLDKDDKTRMDGINLWSDIRNGCFYKDKTENVIKREEFLSIRLCDDGTFGPTWFRKGKWKLIINGTKLGCGLSTTLAPPYWSYFDANLSFIPNKHWYDMYKDFELNGDRLFASNCYENMNETERNNIDNFIYQDIMLFDIENDKIEACNVANKYQDIIDEMMIELYDKVDSNEYKGGKLKRPQAIGVWMQLIKETFNCNNGFSFITQWQDYDSDDFAHNDWNRVWSEAINIIKQCD